MVEIGTPIFRESVRTESRCSSVQSSLESFSSVSSTPVSYTHLDVYKRQVNNQYLGGDTSLACSSETASKIDQKVLEIIKTQHQKARDILQNNQDKLHELANYLLEKETITGEEFMNILNQ